MHPQTKDNIQRAAEIVAAIPGASRGDVIKHLGLEDKVADSTVYRWLDAAVSQGLIYRDGTRKAASYRPSDALRMAYVRSQVRADLSKRKKVWYNPSLLADYVPNKSSLLRPETLKRLMRRCPPGSAPLKDLDDHEVSMFMCDISYASSKLENNNYGLADTIALLEHQIEKAHVSLREKVEILNHRDAVRYIIDGVRLGDPEFGVNSMVMRSVHALLSADLMRDKQMCGRLRTSNVHIHGSSYMPPFVPDQIASAFNEIMRKAAKIKNPYEQSFFLLVHIPYLQPFEDGNKRTARVGCNLPLLKGGVTPISWLDCDDKSYKDALFAIYEQSEPMLMDEIFADSFLHSAERFSLMRRMQNPDPVAARYRHEIKDAIRARILDDEDRISPNVAGDDIVEFTRYIDDELKALRHNEMLGIRYGLTPATVAHWSQRLQQAEEEAAAPRRERVRG